MSVGTRVEQGVVVGRLGNTGRSSGAHLHFEIIIDGQPQNPMHCYNR
ncbi:M23 family metallopeptidase [Geomicrobium sp. JCM 19055]|nr:M23 family metallopeptidase [Geomicrobium sp. JCM 19055]